MSSQYPCKCQEGMQEVETGDSPLSVWLAAVAKSESSGFKREPSGRTPDQNHLVSINTSTDRCSYVHAHHTHACRKEIRLTTKTKKSHPRWEFCCRCLEDDSSQTETGWPEKQGTRMKHFTTRRWTLDNSKNATRLKEN